MMFCYDMAIMIMWAWILAYCIIMALYEYRHDKNLSALFVYVGFIITMLIPLIW